jgi:hypothetical protein
MAVQITRTQIAIAMATEISAIVSSFTFKNPSSVGLVAVSRGSTTRQRAITTAATAAASRTAARVIPRDVHSSNVHAIVNLNVGGRPVGIQPYTVVAPTLFCVTTTAGRRRRLNTNVRIVSDALVDGAADMPDLVAIAARQSSDRCCDCRNDFA